MIHLSSSIAHYLPSGDNTRGQAEVLGFSASNVYRAAQELERELADVKAKLAEKEVEAKKAKVYAAQTAKRLKDAKDEIERLEAQLNDTQRKSPTRPKLPRADPSLLCMVPV